MGGSFRLGVTSAQGCFVVWPDARLVDAIAPGDGGDREIGLSLATRRGPTWGARDEDSGTADLR